MSALNTFLTPGSGNSFSALTAVSTAPAAGKQHIIGSWIICNVSGQALSLQSTIRRSAVDTNQTFSFPLAAGDTLFLHGLLGRVVLNAGDVCYNKSSVPNGIDVTFSIAEEP